ncbi:MAG TPA: MBL fold metallo-hydrolase [Vicinamibacteria bacterium]|jgi:7,8-dihydropterin-6-yl-methyl-4-(beta-D-ribofuranosyl)aminobenzene 5'-phosphate synthase
MNPVVRFAALLLLALVPAHAAEPVPQVRSLRILVLSTMLADAGIGEWGFAALVEVDGQRILFDTGARPETVLQNARELGVDLAGVRDLVLSHNHPDHTGGLVTLRRQFMKKDPAALGRAHVGKGIFLSRVNASGEEVNALIETRKGYEATGGTFVEHDAPVALRPGVWLTGPVPRLHPERNWSPGLKLRGPAGLVDDTVPEDQSLVVNTERGLVVLSGCGHAGIVNTVAYARETVRPGPIHALIGGFHLFAADDAALEWTADRLREAGVENLVGAHCTGIEAVYRLRTRLGLPRGAAVVGAVGSSFELGKGIDPRLLAR